jgi:hypothetical protein
LPIFPEDNARYVFQFHLTQYRPSDVNYRVIAFAQRDNIESLAQQLVGEKGSMVATGYQQRVLFLLFDARCYLGSRPVRCTGVYCDSNHVWVETKRFVHSAVSLHLIGFHVHNLHFTAFQV